MIPRKTMLLGLSVLVLLVLIAAGGYFWSKYGSTKIPAPLPKPLLTSIDTISTYDKDATLKVGLNLPADQQANLQNSITLTIWGDAILHGVLACENGSLNLVVKGNLLVDNLLQCYRPETLPGDDIGNGISIVVTGNVTFTEKAVIATNGHVQIVRSADQLISSTKALDTFYADAPDAGQNCQFRVSKILQNIPDKTPPHGEFLMFGGKWLIGDIGATPRSASKIILNVNFGSEKVFFFKDFVLASPDGPDGKSGKPCIAKAP